MSYRLTGLFFICTILSCVHAGRRSSSSDVEYTCEKGVTFYCPLTEGCLPYSNRCTDKAGGSNYATTCQRKSYTDCHYSSGVFEAYRCSSSLLSRKGPIDTASDYYNCLKKLEYVHHFITYRGFMYEFGREYKTREQDPLDPKYQYRKNGGARAFDCQKVASSATCTNAQIKDFNTLWVDYSLCSSNCQDYARGLGNYINMNCPKPQKGRKREETDFEFAKLIFRLSGQNCTSSLNATQFNATQFNATQFNANSSSSSKGSLTMGMIVVIGIIAELML